jgi:hypothetical protein
MQRKSKTEYNKEIAEELRIQGFAIKEIAKEINCAEITCFINLKNIKPLKYFKETMGYHTVYEFYDLNNDCIYIGQSKNFPNRLRQHRIKSSFYNEIKTITCYLFKSFPDMAFTEAQLIIQKQPKYNKRIAGSQLSDYIINAADKIKYNLNGVRLN